MLLLIVNRWVPRYLADLAFSRQHRLPTLFIGQGKDLDRLGDWITQRFHLGVIPVGYLSGDPPEEKRSKIMGRFWGPPSELAG